jgi:cytochrome subunit of sulfide dehydrogenase
VAASRRDRSRPDPIAKEPRMRSTPASIAAITAAAAALAAGSAAAQSPDPQLARNLAATCANCHGTDGVSQGGTATLAGAGRAELAAKLAAFKSGAAPGTIMPQLAKGYSDAQLELVAAWFAQQQPGR